MKGKKTRRGAQPQARKRTVQIENPDATDKDHPVWSFRRIDTEGPWSPQSERFGPEVLTHLSQFEDLTWQQIKEQAGGRTHGTNSHSLAVPEDLSKEAQKRARKIRLDVDTVFSLRIGGKRRLIGVRRGKVLEILWYDPKHEVAASKK